MVSWRFLLVHFFITLLFFWRWKKKIEITAIISLVVSVAIIVGISLLINVFIGGNVSDTTYYINLISNCQLLLASLLYVPIFYQHLFFVQKSFSFMTKGKGNL